MDSAWSVFESKNAEKVCPLSEKKAEASIGNGGATRALRTVTVKLTGTYEFAPKDLAETKIQLDKALLTTNEATSDVEFGVNVNLDGTIADGMEPITALDEQLT